MTSYYLSTLSPGERPRPPKSLIGGSWIQTNIFCKKIKNRCRFEGQLPSFSALPENPAKARNSFSKLPSNFAVVSLVWEYYLSTPGERPRPPKSLIGGLWIQTNIFCKKIKNRTIFEGKFPSLSALPENPEKARNSFSKLPSNFAAVCLIWGYCLSTPGERPRPPKSLIGGSWVQKNIFCEKIKNRTIFEGKLPSLSALPQNH